MSSTGMSRYRALEGSRRGLAWSASLVRYGLFAAGASIFVDQVGPMISDAQFTWGERRVMGVVAVTTLGGFGLAGWVAGRLLKAAAELVEVFADGAEAAERSAYLIEAHVVPNLARAAAAMERLAAGTEPAPQEPAGRAASSVRKAIADGRWGRAEQLVQAMKRDDPEASLVAAELARARQAEADDLQARLAVAIASDEPEKAIACRDALTQHLRGDALHELDRRVVGWVGEWVQSRARSGGVSPELARLAERAADSFGDSDEGAALLAALPVLRRRAGLCPQCARPYRGAGEACPACRPVTNSRPAKGNADPGGRP